VSYFFTFVAGFIIFTVIILDKMLNILNQSGPVGILLHDVVIEKNEKKSAKVLVIRPGMNQQLKHIDTLHAEKNESGIEYLITEDGRIDWNDVTTDESIQYTREVVRNYKPDLIMAGSRGADLVAEIIKEYDGRILLFGPVHLDDVFKENNIDSSQKNVIIVVHGQNDPNMRINRVRFLVNESKQKLIEIENMGHTFEFNDSSKIKLLVNYALGVNSGESKREKSTSKSKSKSTSTSKSTSKSKNKKGKKQKKGKQTKRKNRKEI